MPIRRRRTSIRTSAPGARSRQFGRFVPESIIYRVTQRVKPNLPIELSNRLPIEQSKQMLVGEAEVLLSPNEYYDELKRMN